MDHSWSWVLEILSLVETPRIFLAIFHSQVLSNNSYPGPNQPSFFKIYSDIPFIYGLPRSYFHIGLLNVLNGLLAYLILATCPAHLSLIDLITLTMLGER